MRISKHPAHLSTNHRGFTLVEMMVSVSLFAVVVTASMGTLLKLIDANGRAQSAQVAADNLSFVTDVITRQLRTGTSYYCTSGSAIGSTLPSGKANCTGNNAIVFTDVRTGDRIGYRHSGTAIERKVDSGSWYSVTGTDIRITEFEVIVSNNNSSAPRDDYQPVATLYLEAEVGDQDNQGSTYQIQTSITQRQLEI